MPLDWSPLWLSLRYAGLATLLAGLMALPLAWLLVERRFAASELVDAVANLSLVMPPAVLVYYLLAASGRWNLAFHWHAAIALSAVYTLPLVLRTMRAELAAVDRGYRKAALGLGAGEWRSFRAVTLPLAWRALAGAVLAGFARAFVDLGATALLAAGHDTAWLLPAFAVFAVALLYLSNRLRRERAPA